MSTEIHDNVWAALTAPATEMFKTDYAITLRMFKDTNLRKPVKRVSKHTRATVLRKLVSRPKLHKVRPPRVWRICNEGFGPHKAERGVKPLFVASGCYPKSHGTEGILHDTHVTFTGVTEVGANVKDYAAEMLKAAPGPLPVGHLNYTPELVTGLDISRLACPGDVIIEKRRNTF